MRIHKLKAKPISFEKVKRNRKSVKYIVIHNTGNKGDTAKNNAVYFANSNTREAGAHFFVDQSGEIWRSIPMNRTAYAVGGFFTKENGAGKHYMTCTNFNSVSIELCDIVGKKPSKAMINSVKWLVKYIRKYCPNAKTIIRHWDVNGKSCPQIMAGKDNANWTKFKKAIR